MRAAAIAIGGLICLIAVQASALEPSPNDPVEPRAFIELFLQEEFTYDGKGLAGRIYEPPSTVKPPPSECECGGPAEGYRDPREDPIVLAESWRIVGSKITKTRAEFTVEFQVLGRTVGKPAKIEFGVPHPPPHQIVSLNRIETEHVTYKLRRTEAGWKIVDPPEQRVNPDVMLKELKHDYQSSKRQIANLEVKVVPPAKQASHMAFTEKVREWLAWTDQRIAAIEQAIRLRDETAKAGVAAQ